MNKTNVNHPDTLSAAITGSGGSGVVTAGQMLLKAVAAAGLFGLMTRSSGPQIRGGESAAMLRLGVKPVNNLDDKFDILLAFDWLNVTRFVDEIPLQPGSLIIRDPDAGEVPPELASDDIQVLDAPLKSLAKTIDGGRPNMIGLGILAKLLGLPEAALRQVAAEHLEKKGEKAVEATQACISLGHTQEWSELPISPLEPPHTPPVRWNISGNEASCMGAVRGGVRFVAAYPITPASEILEWLAPNLEKLGGSLLQAEDELASVNMIIGSSFGGVPSLTATSGPGLSLMMEGLGLAVTSETPLVVSNVMRGGPSTGIPTKSEQSDLNIALYGFHGDAPHLVLAATNIGDCAFTTQWAVYLSEVLQTVAIVLSDQSQGQARSIIEPPAEPKEAYQRLLAKSPEEENHYQRYALTEDCLSPMSIPGTEGCIYTADGLEHNERGTPSSMTEDHLLQLDKRRNKIDGFDYGEAWADLQGEGENCIITWGSSSGAAFEAAQRLSQAGVPTRALALRLLAPLQKQKQQNTLQGVSNAIVVEQNHGAQLYHYLNANQLLPPGTRSMAQPGPLPIRPGDVMAMMTQEADND
ncbi:2-oxoacid:acceptor oxidoreductase subunit alpha [Solemya velesiana gill symbiont]|uniref:2-oxoglutarate synthase n=1 Tax=Solemya velesiana gill symbiont TaxID=1918948 RepID=A0A1T2KY18_9GAMM|nr:2-oxoacid:acceptor oxidoreductase subunit alpha [Solemya velesiana gill symbiont]OOZ37748.1 2-oxoglutarate synthase [Solemya velesiana gill symbiont]